MARARRSDQACHDPPRHSGDVDDVACIFARGIMRLRDWARELSRDSTRSVRLMSQLQGEKR